MIRVSSDSDKQIKSETKRIHRVPTCSVSKAKLLLKFETANFSASLIYREARNAIIPT